MLVEINGRWEQVMTFDEINRRYRALRVAVPIAVVTVFLFGLALGIWIGG